MKFKSKADWWLNGFMLLMCMLTVYMLFSALSQKNSGLLTSGFILLVVDIIFILPMYFLTYYLVDEDFLVIKSGFIFTKKIKVADIVGIAPTHNPLSSAILSSNRIAVYYDKGSKVAREFISPGNKEQFIEALIKLNPDINVKRG